MAIANIIDRLNQMIEENKKIKNSNDTLKSFVSSIFNDTFEKDFIPTSVIQKKLNEDKKEFDEMKKEEPSEIKELIINQKYARIIAFKELLEERNK